MKIILEEGQNVYFTSDTHFNHTNICKGVSKWGKDSLTRDFPDLEPMNRKIVDSINEVVGQDDILFHLGDWSFGGIEQIWEFRKQIICKNIYLILGNHDHHIENDKLLPNIWSDVYDNIHEDKNPFKYDGFRYDLFGVNARDLFKNVFLYLKLEIIKPINKNKNERINLVLCHYPIASWHDMNKGVIHLHGHVHLPPKLKLNQGKAMDVGMDGNYLKPYSLDEIMKTMNKQPIKKLELPKDHHEI